MKREERYERVLAHFRAQMPNVNTELEFGSVFQLLVAVILSAQCTDKRINQVTPDLFRRYPDAKAMAQAEPEDVLEYISSVSYPNAKAAHLVAMARALVAQHGGEVPSDMNQPAGSAWRRQEDCQRRAERRLRQGHAGGGYPCVSRRPQARSRQQTCQYAL